MRSGARRLLKNDASPQECDGYAREKDAGSANSSAIGATEDTVSRRPVLSGGRGFVLQQPTKTEIRLSGSGGQGILLAATLLADAALESGKQVIQTQSYGPEARGGASKAEVIISDEEIDYPEVRSPDVTLCLSQAAFDKYASLNPSGSLIVIDSGLIDPCPVQGVEVIGAPFTLLATQEFERPVVANIVALGALAKHTALVERAALESALGRHLPARLLELNQRALAFGFSIELQPAADSPGGAGGVDIAAGA
jgi:2-oxoglutarate ferredoxin oxidoreductase subunit gamma